MALRDKIAQKAAPALEPGERIQVVFPVQTAHPLLLGGILAGLIVGSAVVLQLTVGGVGFLIPLVIGLAVALPVFTAVNAYRCVVATDRRIAVFDAGRLTISNPSRVLYSLPRATRLGPAGGLWHRLPLGPEQPYVAKRFFGDLAQADALLGPPPPYPPR